MTSAENESRVLPEPSETARTRRSLLTDPSTVAALLVVMSAAVFFVIALTNRHDHSTHVHPGAEVAANVGAEVAADVGASDPQHDHSTHDHSADLGATFASTERIAPPDACRTIIGCDDAGPKPRTPGDRGGWAQLMTLSVIALGLAFITTRVVRTARRAKAAQNKSKSSRLA